MRSIAGLLIVLCGSVFIGCGSSSGGSGAVLPAFTIDTTSLPPASTGSKYSTDLTASGGSQPYTWSLDSGALPPGIALAPDGRLSGTPTQQGTFAFRVRVVDVATASATQNLSISVYAPMTLSPMSIPAAKVGERYRTPFVAGGGNPPYTYGISGAPAWLSMDPSTGMLSGTPPAIDSHTFSVFVDGTGSGRLARNYTLFVQPSGQ